MFGDLGTQLPKASSVVVSIPGIAWLVGGSAIGLCLIVKNLILGQRLGLVVDADGRVRDPLRDEADGKPIVSINPANGRELGHVATTARAAFDALLTRATRAADAWRDVPAPRRGDAVRR